MQRIEIDGDAPAVELLPLVYEELRRLAQGYLRRQPVGHTLQPTALVHEAFMALVDRTRVSFRNRAHFMGISARAMRQILVDHARSKAALKRGGDRNRVPMTRLAAPDTDSEVDVLDLHEALDRLEEIDARASRVVELRFFGGLTVVEAAEVLGVSSSTVDGSWALARAWLGRELATRNSDDG